MFEPTDSLSSVVYYTMGRHDTLEMAKPDSSEKENHAPKAKKQSIPVSKLFGKQGQQHYRLKDGAHDVLGPRPAGISKTKAYDPNFFAKFRAPKKTTAAESMVRDFIGE